MSGGPRDRHSRQRRSSRPRSALLRNLSRRRAPAMARSQRRSCPLLQPVVFAELGDRFPVNVRLFRRFAIPEVRARRPLPFPALSLAPPPLRATAGEGDFLIGGGPPPPPRRPPAPHPWAPPTRPQ